MTTEEYLSAILNRTREIERQYYEINRKLDLLLRGRSAKKISWISGRQLAELTGWDGNELRTARENGTIAFRKYGHSIEYDIDSIPERIYQLRRDYMIAKTKSTNSNL